MHGELSLASQGSLQIGPLQVLTGILSPSWDVCTLRGMEQKARVIRGLGNVALSRKDKKGRVCSVYKLKSMCKHVVMLQKEMVCRAKTNKCVTPKQVKIRLGMRKCFLMDCHYHYKTSNFFLASFCCCIGKPLALI